MHNIYSYIFNIPVGLDTVCFRKPRFFMARGDEYLRRDRDKAVAEDKSGAPGGFQRGNIKNPLMGFHKWMVYNGKSY